MGGALGLDLSLRASGLALVPLDWAPGLDWGRVLVRTVGLPLERDADEWARAHRIVAMANRIVAFAREHDVSSVWIENYAFSQGQSQAHALGELGGAVKLRLYDAGIPWSVVTASSVRKHLGAMPRKGAKAAAHAALRSMGAPADWTGDELDAFALANHGLIVDGHVGIAVPREASKKATRGKAA